MAFTDYLETLATRRKQSHVYVSFQLDGLEIAQMLGDQAHKALYIKLAKEYDAQELRTLAKSIAEKKNIKNKGAYFMAVFSRDRAKFRRARSTKTASIKTARSPRPKRISVKSERKSDKQNNGRKNISTRQSRGGKGSARKNKTV